MWNEDQLTHVVCGVFFCGPKPLVSSRFTELSILCLRTSSQDNALQKRRQAETKAVTFSWRLIILSLLYFKALLSPLLSGGWAGHLAS